MRPERRSRPCSLCEKLVPSPLAVNSCPICNVCLHTDCHREHYLLHHPGQHPPGQAAGDALLGEWMGSTGTGGMQSARACMVNQMAQIMSWRNDGPRRARWIESALVAACSTFELSRRWALELEEKRA